MVQDFADGKMEAILMHVETAKLLEPDERELLEAAGVRVVTLEKQGSDGPG